MTNWLDLPSAVVVGSDEHGRWIVDVDRTDAVGVIRIGLAVRVGADRYGEVTGFDSDTPEAATVRLWITPRTEAP